MVEVSGLGGDSHSLSALVNISLYSLALASLLLVEMEISSLSYISFSTSSKM